MPIKVTPIARVEETPALEPENEVKKSSPKTEPQDILKQEITEQRFENFKAGEINWLEGDFWDSWDKVKGHFHKTIKPNSKLEFPLDESPKVEKWFFLAHGNDTIVGKPQLIEGVMKRIPLIRLTVNLHNEETVSPFFLAKTLSFSSSSGVTFAVSLGNFVSFVSFNFLINLYVRR